MSTKRVNPLKPDALTLEDVRCGTRIISWRPGEPKSVKHLTIASEEYFSDEGDLVIDATTPDGTTRTYLTSELGLTCQRYSPDWVAIAILNEEEE